MDNPYELVDFLIMLSKLFELSGIVLCIVGIVLAFKDETIADKEKQHKARIVRAVALGLAVLFFIGNIVVRKIEKNTVENIIVEYRSSEVE